MLSRSVLLIAATALIAVPTADATVVGPSTGATATRDGAQIVVTLTPAALAATELKVGAKVDADCSLVPAQSALLLGPDDDDNGGGGYGRGTVVAGGVIHVKLDSDINEQLPAALDVCEIDGLHQDSPHSSTTWPVARVPLTPAGATYIDESERAVALKHLLQKAKAKSGYQPAGALGAGVVALDTRDATPPSGQLGYWTDGTHATVATLSTAGRRLVIEDRGSLVLRSNVLDQMDPLGADALTPDDLPASTPKDTKVLDDDGSKSPYKGTDWLSSQDGVWATRSGRHVTVRFTGRSAAAFRALHGRRVVVSCVTDAGRELFPDLLAQPQAGGYGVARVPSHGGELTVALRGGTGDICFVGDDQTLVALLGVNGAGRAWVQDLAALRLLYDDNDLTAPGGKTYLPTAKALARLPRGNVAMSGPDGPVPAGKVGVWTDGARKAAVVARSGSGHRFSTVDEGDGMVRTNLLSTFSGLLLGLAGGAS